MKTNAGLFALLIKTGPKILSGLAKLVKGLKVGKVGLATASLASYAYMFTWEFAALIMITLFVHESGHIWAMKRCGIKTKGIYFIPFVGGAAVQEEECHSKGEDVFISLMGPIWGYGLTLIVAALYYIYEEPVFAAAASWMALVNLFNLFPIMPLDGGRVLKSITFSIKSGVGFIFLFIGLLISGYVLLTTGMSLFVFLFVVGCLDLFVEVVKRLNKNKKEPWYKRITLQDDIMLQIPKLNGPCMIISLGGYLLLIGLLFVVMDHMKHIPGAALALEFLKS